MNLSQILSSDPEIMHGVLVFQGTRVPVQTLIDHLTADDSLDVFLDDFPSVSREQVVAFLEMPTREAQAAIKALWAKEAEDRIAGYVAGQIEAFEVGEVLANETAQLSEPSLSDWNRPEEDAAWAHLQRER